MTDEAGCLVRGNTNRAGTYTWDVAWGAGGDTVAGAPHPAALVFRNALGLQPLIQDVEHLTPAGGMHQSVMHQLLNSWDFNQGLTPGSQEEKAWPRETY